MKESKITPDTITYNSAISACEKAGGIHGAQNALQLLEEMKDSGMLNDELGKTKWLDLHKNAFYSKQIWEELS